MKKIKLLIVLICLAFTNFLFGQNSDECPPPYTRHIVWVGPETWLPRGHNWSCAKIGIEYCCYWDEISLQLKYEVSSFWFYCLGYGCECQPPPNEWNTFRLWADTIILIDAIKNCNVNLPSCDELPTPPQINVKEYIPSCWYWENYHFTKYPNEEDWFLILRSCKTERGKCLHEYVACIDYSKVPPEIIILFNNWEIIESPTCPFDEPTIPPPGKTWEATWRTTCFARSCFE
ncbi:hypothetical protein D9V87_01630 [Bacteroidetes/Chlorobi group bacterium MS-B_bin-24]|jgi:hypothetical protein|nr:MAG: hypothetical protein D9V87_01630 [Bacteroidetes/Chlorobi group bacterium MS-B_bin-24]